MTGPFAGAKVVPLHLPSVNPGPDFLERMLSLRLRCLRMLPLRYPHTLSIQNQPHKPIHASPSSPLHPSLPRVQDFIYSLLTRLPQIYAQGIHVDLPLTLQPGLWKCRNPSMTPLFSLYCGWVIFPLSSEDRLQRGLDERRAKGEKERNAPVSANTQASQLLKCHSIL